jgi:GNAT superfamily N-acetyltransferase
MSVRFARYSDLDSIADTLAAAFWDGDAVGRFMHPHREKYPQDFREWWKRSVRTHYWDPKSTLLVSTDETGNVTGYANWVAHGTSAQKVELWKIDPRKCSSSQYFLRDAIASSFGCKDSYIFHAFSHIIQYLGNIMKPLANLYNKLSNVIWPNRAADPTKIHSYEDAAPFFKHHWTGLHANGWQLETLAVHPKFQGKGYGKSLVTWGLDIARQGQVPASVVSAEGKEEFYLRCGFDIPGIIGNICEGEGNPLNGVTGGAVLFKDP